MLLIELRLFQFSSQPEEKDLNKSIQKKCNDLTIKVHFLTKTKFQIIQVIFVPERNTQCVDVANRTNIVSGGFIVGV